MKYLSTNLTKSKAVTFLRILYPIWAVIGMFSIQYVPSALIVIDDALKTANNIVSNEFLFRLGIAGSLVTQLIHIVVVLVLYKLFEKVNKSQASLIVILGLVGVPIAMLNTLNRVAALLLVDNPDLMMFFLNLNKQGMHIAGIFWGLWLFPIGKLILESKYFPRIFGHLIILAGFAYFFGSFARLLFPGSEKLISTIEIPTYGEVLFMIWVLFKGARLPKTKS